MTRSSPVRPAVFRVGKVTSWWRPEKMRAPDHGVPRVHDRSCGSIGAGMFRPIRGCVYRSGDTSGEGAQKNHRSTGESSFVPTRQEARHVGDRTRGPPTRLGVPTAHVRDEEPLVTDERSTLCVRSAPSLPAGIRQALNARRERDRPTMRVQLRSCTQLLAVRASALTACCRRRIVYGFAATGFGVAFF